MQNQPATKRSVVLVAAMAVISVGLLAFATRAADDKKPDKNQAKTADLKEDGTLLFNGTDFTGWKFREDEPDRTKVWKIAEARLDPKDPKKLIPTANSAKAGGGNMLRGEGHGCDIYTDKSFGDCQLHVEFMIPEESNSGVYLMGQYEVQIFSSFGKPADKLSPADCGGIYNTRAPTANPLKPYGQWNSFDIIFHAPKFDDGGKKTQNARFENVALNGVKIHENVDAPRPTGSELPGGEKATGPLLLQGDHGIVAFRSIRIKELDKK